MNKSSISILAKAISSKRGLKQAEAERFITKMFEVANEGLQEDKLLKMKWLGTFKVTAVKDRESIDVNTGERILIEGRDKITFTPDNILKEIINKPFAQFETVVLNDGVDFTDIDEKFANLSDKDTDEVVDASLEVMADETEVVSETSQAEASTSAIGDATSEQAPEKTQPEQIAEDEVHVFGGAEENAPISDDVQVISDDHVQVISNNDVQVISEKAEVIPQTQIVGEQAPAQTVSQAATQTTSQAATQTTSKTATQSVSLTASQSQEKAEDVQVKEVSKQIQEQSEPVQDSADGGAPVSEQAYTKHPATEIVQQPAKTIQVQTESIADSSSEEETSAGRHHFVIPKYVVIIVCVLFVGLAFGIAWLSFSYGKMAAQQDHLMTQINDYKKSAKPKAPAQKKPTPTVDNSQAELKRKAQEDSIRMAKASAAVKMAEEAEKKVDSKEVTAKETSPKKEEVAKNSPSATSFDNDPRVRTGAYRIVGISQTITVKDGQTFSSISKLYLGPGMECYVEAVNGNVKEVKAGQKIKIPKLELKKRK